MKKTSKARTLVSLGPIVVAASWSLIALCWWLNREWFIFTEHAFSDFGKTGKACCPWLYNYGLIVLGTLMTLYGVGLAISVKEKLEAIGASHIALAGVFLALIGLFPAGTRHHVFVSTWFFAQSYIGLLLFLSSTSRRHKASKYTLAIILASIPIGLILEATIGWPSAATLEAYGAIIISIGVITTTQYTKRTYSTSAKNHLH